jgi:hypothetical protein
MSYLTGNSERIRGVRVTKDGIPIALGDLTPLSTWVGLASIYTAESEHSTLGYKGTETRKTTGFETDNPACSAGTGIVGEAFSRLLKVYRVLTV